MKLIITIFVWFCSLSLVYATSLNCPREEQLADVQINSGTQVKPNTYIVIGQLIWYTQDWIFQTDPVKTFSLEDAIDQVKENLRKRFITYVGQHENQCFYDMEFSSPWKSNTIIIHSNLRIKK